MLKYKKIKIGKGFIETLVMDLAKKRLIVLRGRYGYVMCGYLNLKAARNFNDAAAKITGVSNIKGALKAKVFASTPRARRLGVYPGQPIREALKLMA
ncbi:MAG: DUF1805 domain-containing protein [Candidatus Omnitrophota bacterium]|jgi:uncharacterized protein YunC (DUF1805 family)